MLFPQSLLFDAAHVDHGVALEFDIDKYVLAIVPPPAFIRVCCAAVILPIVIRFHAVQETVKVLTVVIVPAVKFIVCGGVSTLKSLNVFDHVKLKDPDPAPVIHILLNVSPPPENVFV